MVATFLDLFGQKHFWNKKKGYIYIISTLNGILFDFLNSVINWVDVI
jgi:hypothetical protein